MKKIFTILVLLIAFIVPNQGQEKLAEIHGVVSDSIGNPIPDVTVFIPFTSIGTTTNLKGEYKLGKIPAGDLELVFRHLSYLPVSNTLTIGPSNLVEINISMKGNIVELAEIVKRANPDDWKFGYEKFKEHVLGDPLGRFCEVVNPTDIYFYYDGKKLTGNATKPLEIINNYLGYKLVYFLDYFWYTEGQPLPDGTIDETKYAFSGEALYEELDEGSNLRKGIRDKNRKTEYQGTLPHFLQSVYNNQLSEQGYVLKEVWKDVKDLQKSENLSPSMAFVKYTGMKKIFYFDSALKKSTYLHFLPDQNYSIKVNPVDSLNINTSKIFSLDDKLIVLYYRDANYHLNDPRIVYLAIDPDASGIKPCLIVEQDGKFEVQGGKMIWSYLDTQTKLITALPADYEETIK